MTNEEYEIAIGKLVLLKLYLTHPHKDAIDDVIEGLEDEYIRRLTNNEL